MRVCMSLWHMYVGRYRHLETHSNRCIPHNHWPPAHVHQGFPPLTHRQRHRRATLSVHGVPAHWACCFAWYHSWRRALAVASQTVHHSEPHVGMSTPHRGPDLRFTGEVSVITISTGVNKLWDGQCNNSPLTYPHYSGPLQWAQLRAKALCRRAPRRGQGAGGIFEMQRRMGHSARSCCA